MGQTILFVEDEPAIAENIKFALETEVYEEGVKERVRSALGSFEI